jgi:predicted GNAT superfamily acetyltransferase
MADEISVRPVETLDEAKAAAELFDRVWGEKRVIGTPLLWAMASHGGQVLAAFRAQEIVGAQVGVIGLVEGEPTLHSHITGVLADVQHHGVGFLLKKAQRDWCLERGIERVTWTFDPMVARNAYFNLVKLGAVAERFHRDYYGEMEDAFNRGDRSDRLEVVWHLRSERVLHALGLAELDGPPGSFTFGSILLTEQEGRPLHSPVNPAMSPIWVHVPPTYHQMREDDPDLARAWRDAVGDALESVFDQGFRAVGFERRAGYLLERA